MNIINYFLLFTEMENKPCDRAVTGPYSSVAGTSLPIILLTALATTVAL